MFDGGRSMRARDADRERTIAALDTAYVEGQLTAEAREQRVAGALEARTLGDLDRLVTDLQHDLPPAAGPGPRIGLLVGIGVALTAVLAVGIAVIAGQLSSDEPTPPTTVEAEPVPVIEVPPLDDSAVEDPVVEDPVPAHEPLTVPALREFIDAYRGRFGTVKIYDASFDADGWVFFDTPYGEVRKNRLQSWHWTPTDGFADPGDPTANVFDYAPVNLRRIDLRALVENVEHARRYLNIDEPTVRIRLQHREDIDDGPEIRFNVSNEFGESAWMTTTLAGRLIRSEPFSPDGQ